MLDLQHRQLLREALRPPAGYALDRAVMTTFSLDLITILTVPFAFSFFQLKDEAAGRVAADPLALLESLRRFARRITIFCQAGEIYLPKNVQPLVSYLERSIHEVTSPRGGVFHPKVAVLRYVPTDRQEGPGGGEVRYRLLCSSRNLTFDRSWDTMLILNGRLSQGRRNAHAGSRPLSRFIAALPAMRLHREEGDDDLTRAVAGIADELLRVSFDAPDEFDEFEFRPIGIDGEPPGWPVLGGRRTLTVAPFVTDGFVRRMTASGGEHHLVSRHESLDALAGPSLAALSYAYFMNAAADAPEASLDPQTESDAKPGDHAVSLAPSHQLSGLHAKLFVEDDGSRAHVWTGSANATTAAFDRNVEFLVRLTGKRRYCGVDSMLGVAAAADDVKPADRTVRFADLLLPYARQGPPIVDSAQVAIDAALNLAQRALIVVRLCGRVAREAGEAERYRISIERYDDATAPAWPAAVSAECGLITVPSSWTQLIPSRLVEAIAFEGLTFEALTSFVSFRLTARLDGSVGQRGFVLNLPMSGMPTDRESRILTSMLRNREQLLRYFLLLLADDEDAAMDAMEVLAAGTAGGADRGNACTSGLPLLEPLLRIADREPGRLGHVARVLDDLDRTPEGRALVPDEFREIWRPIWEATQAARERKGGHV